MNNNDRNSTLIRTRKLDRARAKYSMKKRGMIKINKKKNKDSYFAKHWREYSEG